VDGYEVALKELVQAKIDHAPLPKDEEAAKPRGKVVSLMDALRKSIGEGEDEAQKKKPAAKAGAGTQKGLALVKPVKAETKAGKTVRRKSA
jgi:DNA end-binding protein Ku